MPDFDSTERALLEDVAGFLGDAGAALRQAKDAAERAGVPRLAIDVSLLHRRLCDLRKRWGTGELERE